MPEEKGGRPTKYSEEIAEKVIAYIRKGLTWERAAEAVGIPERTIQGWQESRPAFRDAIKKARRELEASLLDSISEAGVKHWQAKAWIAERVFGYAQPSARVDVKAELNHGLSPSLAAMLAGIHSRSTTYVKSAQVVDNQASLDNVYCATNEPALIPAGKSKIDKLSKRKLVRQRKLQRTTTPPRDAPNPPKFSHTPPEKTDQNKKEDGEAPQEQA
jgi:hypothetical protein